MARWFVCMTVTTALLIVAWMNGFLGEVLLSDQTGIVWIVIAICMFGAISSNWFPFFNDWVLEHGLTLMVGLLGTVVGFTIAINGAVTNDVAIKLSGVDTALTTTAVGIVTHIYLLVLQRVMR